MGALIHASLALHAEQLKIDRPADVLEPHWRAAVDGRVLHLQIKRPLAPKVWWIVGIYQHVAKAANAEKRKILFRCLEDIRARAERDGCCLVVLGDVNAAPLGGRWRGERQAPPREPDVPTMRWASRQGLTEVQQRQVQPTWKASLRGSKAWLDRVWYYPVSLGISDLEVRWSKVDTLFDHALVMVRLPRVLAGVGFAGASREREFPRRPPRCKVDVPALKEKRDEWMALVQERLKSAPLAEHLDPFGALQAALRIADDVAQEIAPKAKRSESYAIRQRPFTFRGNVRINVGRSVLDSATNAAAELLLVHRLVGKHRKDAGIVVNLVRVLRNKVGDIARGIWIALH